MIKTALITGATSGIGKAAAFSLGLNGYRLILTGRRKQRLEELKTEVEQHKVSCKILVFDVRDRDETQYALEALPEKWKQIDVLVNNAGLAAGFDPIDKGNLDDWDLMIDTNVKGLLNVSRTVIPWMVERKIGHIINVASIAGKEVYPNGNVYCASKHAVDALSEAMRIDLVHHNIRVTNIAPGLVETEFSEVRFHGDKERAKQVYQGYEPLTAANIADCILFAVSRPPHMNIADMTILPTAQANSTTVIKK
ncbi:MAG TPA: NAD(P)-dependent oxidoreductase [Flavobacteriales bacterium]|jgi:3-hydroxy acid dehydrogenase/malonic semialdehyde reductase|nr:NAD(P)-dependent oxidoreductase [Flavobacteriales bacterium]